MVGSRLNVHLYRDSFNTPWGFRLQGGTDLNQPLVVQRVFSNSPAEGELQRGDIILSINTRDGTQLTHKQAQDLIKHGGGQVQLVIQRPPPGTQVAPLSPAVVTQRPRAPSLQQPPKMPSAGSSGFMPTKITMNKYGGGGPNYGSDFGGVKTPAQRVNTSLDTIVLSPHTPEVPQGSPFYAPLPETTYRPPPPQPQPVYQPPPPVQQPMYALPPQPEPMQQAPPPQPAPVYAAHVQFSPSTYVAPNPQQMMTPSELLMEQQRLDALEHEAALLASTASRPLPRVPKPKPGNNNYAKMGVDYREPGASTWQPPQPARKPAPALQAQTLPHAPTWQRPPQVEDDNVPAWKSTLKSSVGSVKPWDRDLLYNTPDGIRSVQFHPEGPAPGGSSPAQVPSQAPVAPAPAAAPYAPTVAAPFSPPPAPQPQENGPKVVHLQYNSPMGLYSKENVEETYKGQTAALAEAKSPTTPAINQIGDRDWSQSAVLRFIESDNKRGKPAPPPTAPKPAPVQAPAPVQVPEDFGASDF